MKLKDQISRVVFILVIGIYFLTSFISATGRNPGQDLPKRGAQSPEELSDVLFTSLKQNEFNQLNSYIPEEEEIIELQRSASEQNKPFFENLDEAMVEARIQEGFDEITREGIEKNINWSNVELIDYETRSCSIEMIGCNVTFSILDQKNNQLIVTYDAVKISDRWFLFQNLGFTES